MTDEQLAILREIADRLGWRPKIMTIHLPPPPEYIIYQVGTVGIVVYEN